MPELQGNAGDFTTRINRAKLQLVRKVRPQEMKQSAFRCIVIGMTLRTALCQCSGSPLDVSEGSDVITAPGYPDVDTAETCTWNFYLGHSPRILLLTVTDIQLYYLNESWETGEQQHCSETLTVGSYDVNGLRGCYDKEPFCRVYYSSDACHTKLPKAKDISWCDKRRNHHESISVKFTSDGKSGQKLYSQLINFPRGFKMEYGFLDCLSETTPTTTLTAKLSTETTIPKTSSLSTKTTAAPTTTASGPTTKPLISRYPPATTTSQRAKTLSSPATKPPPTSSNNALNHTSKEYPATSYSAGMEAGSDFVMPIIVSCAAFLLIILVVGAALVYKRNRPTQTPVQENEYIELQIGQSAQAAPSGAYENTPSGQPGVSNEPSHTTTRIVQSQNRVGGNNQAGKAEEHTTSGQAQQTNQSTLRNPVMNQSESGEYTTLNLIQPTPNQPDAAGEYSTLNLNR